MIKYYVYLELVGDQKIPVFISNPTQFAINEYEPIAMEWSGICIEAQNEEHAYDIYLRPHADDVVLSCNEPLVTVARRNVLREKRERTYKDYIKQSAEALHQLAVVTSELARHLRASDIDAFTEEEIFHMLIKRHAEELPNLRYRPTNDS